MDVVVGKTAEVDDNVLILMEVLLGSNVLENVKRHQTIEDNLFLGPRAIISAGQGRLLDKILYLPAALSSGIAHRTGVKTMKRVTINALVDIGCLVTFIPSLITGLVLYLVLPSGGGRGTSWAVYLGITRAEWLILHDVTSLAFAVLLIIHLLLHWKFFRNIPKALRRQDIEPGKTREGPL